jgi:hypothetical protein
MTFLLWPNSSMQKWPNVLRGSKTSNFLQKSFTNLRKMFMRKSGKKKTIKFPLSQSISCCTFVDIFFIKSNQGPIHFLTIPTFSPVKDLTQIALNGHIFYSFLCPFLNPISFKAFQFAQNCLVLEWTRKKIAMNSNFNAHPILARSFLDNRLKSKRRSLAQISASLHFLEKLRGNSTKKSELFPAENKQINAE